METLPEFRVVLTRLQPGETAYPSDGPHYEDHGQRTKLGGDPDWIQSEDVPRCPDCDELMSFVAQIDSVEHQWESNLTAIVELFAAPDGQFFGEAVASTATHVL